MNRYTRIAIAVDRLLEAALEVGHATKEDSSESRYTAALDDLQDAAIEYAKAVEKESESQCKKTTS